MRHTTQSQSHVDQPSAPTHARGSFVQHLEAPNLHYCHSCQETTTFRSSSRDIKVFEGEPAFCSKSPTHIWKNSCIWQHLKSSCQLSQH